MTKIPNLFAQNPLVISQGRHTQGWGAMSASVAIDFAYTGDLICPFDGCRVELHSNSDQGQQSYFSLILPDGSRLICVHGFPVRTGVFNKGEIVGKCRWHHWHISMIVNGQLDCIMSYLDRSITTQTQPRLYGGDSNHPDCQWSNYEDKQLNIQIPQLNQKDMLKESILSKPDILNEVAQFNRDFIFSEVKNDNPEPLLKIFNDTARENNERTKIVDEINNILGGGLSGEELIAQINNRIDYQNQLKAEKRELEAKIQELEENQVRREIRLIASDGKNTNITPKVIGPDGAVSQPYEPSKVQTQKEMAFNTIQNENLNKLKSRKLWSVIVGVIYAVTSVYKPELRDVLPQILSLILGYIGIQGVQDIITNKK